MLESDIEVLLLGTAQDGGYPQFGCTCANCKLCYEGKIQPETPVSLAILDKRTKNWWLVDATPQLNQQWAEFALILSEYKLAGVILTHAHAGHYPGILYLGKECMNANKIPLYASVDMHRFLKANEPWGVMYRNENILQVDVSDKLPFKLTDTLSVIPHAVRHRADFTDTLAFTFIGEQKRLFFCPDIDAWDGMSESLSAVATANDVLLLDATFYVNNELPGRDTTTIPHPRVVQTVDLLVSSGVLQSQEHPCAVYLIHINHSNRLLTDVPLVQSLAEKGIQVGKKGLTWKI